MLGVMASRELAFEIKNWLTGKELLLYYSYNTVLGGAKWLQHLGPTSKN